MDGGDGQHLLLPRGRGREPIRVRQPERPTGQVVQAEFGYGAIYLTVTREMPDPGPVPSRKAGGRDIGVIHLGMVSDGEEALAISGRGLRSVKQGRAKALTKLQKKRSRTQPGSRRRNRLNRARHPKNRHQRSRRTNQEVGALEFGRLEQYLEYKLRRHGIPLVKISEADTSQTCPQCGHLTKVAGRTYRCRACHYRAHHDGVGAVNILNKGMHGEIRPERFLVPQRTRIAVPSLSQGVKA